MAAIQKTVVDAKDAAGIPPVTEAQPVIPAKIARFWKGVNPHQEIVFKDGTSLRFGREAFATADADLAKKIKAVAGDYGILEG